MLLFPGLDRPDAGDGVVPPAGLCPAHTVRIELPARMNRLLAHDDEWFDVEVLDLTPTTRVEVPGDR